MVLLELPHEQSLIWALLNYFNNKVNNLVWCPRNSPDAGCSLAITPEFLKIDDLLVLAVSVGVPGFDHLHYMSFQPEQDIKRLLMPDGSGILMGRHYFDHIRYENRGAKVMLLKQAFNRH